LCVLFIVGVFVIPARSEIMTVNVGDEITVSLAGKPSTGFSWSYNADKSSNPENARVTFKGVKPKKKGAMVGGDFVFEFAVRALEPGSVTLLFGYARAWESKPPLEEHVVDLKITN